jgi:hypothetical protein
MMRCYLKFSAFCLTLFCLCAAQAQTNSSIWIDHPGDGFNSTAQSISVQLGASHGVSIFGGNSSHGLALTSLTYGHMWGPKLGGDHWYSGNVEFRAELFTGAQYEPTTEWIVGLTPHLRYDFATGTRWVPYMDLGAGTTATSIGGPDLGGAFEFNLQAAAGVMYFIKDDLALTAEARFMHLSSAGIEHPNLGVNTVFGMAGISWFF